MTLTEKAGCLRLNVGLSKGLWATTLSMVCYLVNELLCAKLDGRVAQGVWTGNPIDLSSLRNFGCPGNMHISSKDRSKIDPKLKPCIFVGYNKVVKGYKLWDLFKINVVISRDVVFDEQSMLKQ